MDLHLSISEVAPAGSDGCEQQEIALARLALMNKLQLSLAGSHGALLELDLAGMQEKTSEQIGLSGDLQALLRRLAALSAAKHSSGSGLRSGLPGTDPNLVHALGRSEVSVLRALRLQMALLRRAQQRLRIVANTLAGSSVDYGLLIKKSSSDNLSSENLGTDWNRGIRIA
jgi:hypothetical protein